MESKFDYDLLKKKFNEFGLKCGLEIHQQLEGRKLFCNCATDIVDSEPFDVYKRRLNISLGELNELDNAAKEEIQKGKLHTYYAYKSTCAVERDEEPPHSPSQKAIESSLIISELFNANVANELHFMRKIVLDGSNTSGFQRTGLVAIDGFLEVDGKKYSVESICLEEDSAKNEKRTEVANTYNTSRLGIPLIEIATGPDISSPEEVSKVASQIGLTLRSLKNAKRGLGSIRQDLNVSIVGGVRVEIKGAQTLDILNKTVELEAMRQYRLKEVRTELLSEIDLPDVKSIDLTEKFKNTESKILKSALQKRGVIYASKIKGFKGIFGIELNPSRRVGSEFADRVKHKSGLKGLFHSDELPNYGVTDNEVNMIRDSLNLDDNDGFLLVSGDSKRVKKAFNAISDYMKELFTQEKGHVRQPREDGTSAFQRVMPGKSRMYPETDVKPQILSDFSYEIPKQLDEIQKDLEDLGLHKDMAKTLSHEKLGEEFLDIIKSYEKLKPNFIAENLLSLEKRIQEDFKKDIVLTLEDFKEIFDLIENDKVSKANILKIASLKHEGVSFEDVAKDNGLILLSKDALKSKIKEEISNMDTSNKKRAFGILMGKFAKLGSPKDVKEIIENNLN